MKQHEIKVGGYYQMRVGASVEVVRVDSINKQDGTRYSRGGTGYSCTNLRTGRKVAAASAAKFRLPIPTCDKCKAPFTTFRGSQKDTCLTCLEGKPRSINFPYLNDPTIIAPMVHALATAAASGSPTSSEDEQGSDPTPASDISPASSTPPSASASTAERNGVSPLAARLQNAAKHVEVKKAKSEHPPTVEQQAIIDVAVTLKRGDVLVVGAGAGTGKTTTLTMLEQELPGRGQYTAFNSALVKESGRKFKKIECNTTHSLAFRAIGKKYAHRLGGGRVRSSDVAVQLGIEGIRLTGETPEATARTLSAALLAGQVMGAIRRFCQSADRQLDESHFRYLDGIDMPGSDGQRTYTNNKRVREYLLPFAEKAWADLTNPDGSLPFTHDHYVKIWQLNKPVISADYILLDEAQDTAPVMLDILKQQKALIILVGDDAQQIYEWRGAVNAMEESEWPNSQRRYLTQSFRFGQAVADVANSILKEIGTPLRLRGLASIASRVEACADPTAVLCRTNAVAVGTLLRSIAEGKRPFLVGGGSDVVSFVKGAQELQQGGSTSHPELACFQSWDEVEQYSKLDEGEDLKLMVKLINSFGCAAILGALQGMVREESADLTICTAHKSKGREWHSVKLANDFPTLSKATEADLKLLYVAATRAKLVLDTTDCPFFTGEDALEIVPTAPDAMPVLPPAPAAPPATATDFTWSKGKNDGWLVRGPKGKSGETVQVVRRDGSKSQVRLGKVQWENDQVALYERG